MVVKTPEHKGIAAYLANKRENHGKQGGKKYFKIGGGIYAAYRYIRNRAYKRANGEHYKSYRFRRFIAKIITHRKHDGRSYRIYKGIKAEIRR